MSYVHPEALVGIHLPLAHATVAGASPDRASPATR